MKRLRPIRSGGRAIGLIPLLMIVALMASGCTKMTGGGWIRSLSLDEGEKATFGLTALCKNTTTTVAGISVPTAVLHGGQFQFEDHALGVSVHGTVERLPLQEFPSMTCKDLRAEPNLLGTGIFGGTYQTQPGMTPAHTGEFVVQVFDGGKPPHVDPISGTVLADSICIELAGVSAVFSYDNCGDLEGGSIKVE
jgi:hypothetical protein